MPNPRLTSDQLKLANQLLAELRMTLNKASDGDASLLWALRRKIAKELVYDERGKPNHRRKLKTLKRQEQNGLCPLCGETLPSSYCVLDRLSAIGGYTPENTRLLCQPCDFKVQKDRCYS